MYEVEELFRGGPGGTSVWASQIVVDVVSRRKRTHRQQVLRLLKRLERYAQAGFGLWEGANGPIRHEWDGVYRIGHVDDLFRIIGFYENDSRRRFVAIDCFEKSGQRLSAAERTRIDRVARVKREGLWHRREQHGQDSRSTSGP